jgi:hypothetical protein
MAKKVDASLLQGRWLHAHEEDRPGAKVFRPDTHPLPASRGRTGFVFQPDGTLLKVGPGPVDRGASTPGTWTLDPDGRLTIRVPGASEEVIEVESLEQDRLVAKT